MKSQSCRLCGHSLCRTFVDLGMSPLSNSYLEFKDLQRMEPFFPLHVFVCERCFLVQLEEFENPENIFNDYAYFSSFSQSWLRHANDYAEAMTEQLNLDHNSLVIEVASNDGYLLQYFAQNNIPVLGIEPAANVADAAQKKGITTLVKFFGTETAYHLAREGKKADLLLGNNVLAHVPQLNDFVAGLKVALKPNGVITMEFPHLLRLMEGNQFDTIYHEHFSYFSFSTVNELFQGHGLLLFDVEELPTHGGSLRIFACHAEAPGRTLEKNVARLLFEEKRAGLQELSVYDKFGLRVAQTKQAILEFLIKAKRAGKTIAGYGAPAKGNTLLNYCGIRTDFIDYTVDLNPYKQQRYLPGTHIPIYAPEKIAETRPDYLFILPWNIKDEIMEQMASIRSWGGQFVIPIPTLEVLP